MKMPQGRTRGITIIKIYFMDAIIDIGKTEKLKSSEDVSNAADLQSVPSIKGLEGTSIPGSIAVLEILMAEKVDTIFGYPGGAIMPVYDALYDYREKINHILVRHEQGAIHAAQGYARSSGHVGVVLVTSGPGATNLVTGLADAMIDSTPLVCITGQVYAHLLGTDAF